MSKEIGLKAAEANPSSLRELTPAEWELVAGGYWTDGFGNPEISVGGSAPSDPDPWPYYPDYDDGGEYDYGGGGGDTDIPPADADVHDVDVKIDRPLTAEEQKAVNDLKAFADRITTEINKIPNNAVLTLSDGRTVTGAEIKALWANADFVINPANTAYDNGSNRGETDYNSGNPVISVNIDVLVGYDKNPGGISYFALHELSHLTVAASQYNNVPSSGTYNPDDPTREQVANTIAWAVAYAAGESILANPEHGYDPANPTFVLPPPIEATDPGYDDYHYYTGGDGTAIP